MEIDRFARAEMFQTRFKNFKMAIERYKNAQMRDIDQKGTEEIQYETNKIKRETAERDQTFYSRCEKDIKIGFKVFRSRKINEARLSKMKARYEMIEMITEDTKRTLTQKIKNQGFYEAFLKELISQGLIKMFEEQIQIKCLKKDLQLVKKLTGECVSSFAATTGMPMKATINERQLLDEKEIGGIVLTSLSGKIVCDNTIRARLSYASQQMLPQIREILFKQSDQFFANGKVAAGKKGS